MEFKRIQIGYGYVERGPDGALGASGISNYISLGMPDQARKYAEAILELLDDEPKPEKVEAHTYITTNGETYDWDDKKILHGWTETFVTDERAIEAIIRHEDAGNEYHIFRLVATVGPIPQPSERKVTRYE